MLELLNYPPIIRGLFLLVISGFTFPLGGMFILRLNILPLRYLLMHGVLLGGAIGLVMGWDLSISSLLVNLVLIFLLNYSSRKLKSDYGYLTMFFMIFAIALTSVIVSIFNVPAKDTLSLLWGNLYSSNLSSIILASAIGVGLIVFSTTCFKHLTALFYDKEIAKSLGIHVSFMELMILCFTTLVIAVSMKIMGALLLDAQLILPVVIAGMFAKGLKQNMIYSCLFGGFFSISGFFVSLFFDIPLSAGVALPSLAVFIIVMIRIRRN